MTTREQIEEILKLGYTFISEQGKKDIAERTDRLEKFVLEQVLGERERIHGLAILADCELPNEGKDTKEKFYHLPAWFFNPPTN